MNPKSRLTQTFLILIPVISAIWIMSEIDPAGNYPQSRQGPGITIDESFNVEQGYFLFEAMWSYGFALLDPASAKEIFSAPSYMPDHPPLGRFAIGIGNRIGNSIAPDENNPSPFSVVSGRWSSAFLFGLQLLLIGYATCRWYGSVAGISAMVSLLLMPRVFGHAHLASLETMMNLTYSAVVIAIGSLWKPGTEITYKQILIAGFLLGLALLTKIQGVLLPIPIGLWAFYYWRKKAIAPVILWGCFGVFVFYLLWPWLWLNPIENSQTYLGRATDRVSLNNFYIGQSWKDVDVPFHYTFVMFMVTVPVGLLLLGAVSIFSKKDSAKADPRKQLLLLCAFFPFLVFAKNGTAVYDGVRLFLTAFPLWAILAGQGASILFSKIELKFSKSVAASVLVIALGLQATGNISMSPCYLSYYNLLTRGLSGAEELGFETTYWGDSITRDFLEEAVSRVPEKSKIQCFPVLHMNQLRTIQNQSPILDKKQVTLIPYDEKKNPGDNYLLIFRKKADIPESLSKLLQQSDPIVEYSKNEVWLAALYELPEKN